jgi:beta-lactamase class A
LLRQIVDDIAGEVGARRLAVAFYDWDSATAWSLRGGEWFHAASTIKLAILLGLVRAVGEGRLDWDDWLHVRNRFASRLDAEPFRVARERDADGVVHAEIGKLMKVRDLAERMIVASSNLATNLLLDLLGVRESQQALAALGVEGVELARGVEDIRSFEAGIYNRVTADGMLGMLRLLVEPSPMSGDGRSLVLDLLARQELTGAIGLGLPEAVRGRAKVAHKTGEIATAAHDAGLVFLPDRRPLALVVLSEWPAGSDSRQAALGKVVGEVFGHLVGGAGVAR